MNPSRPSSNRACLVLVTASVYALLAIGPRPAAAQGTDTSTTGIQFPEDGGGLPRAQMPEGGVEKPWNPPPKEGAREQPKGPATQPHPHHHGEGHHGGDHTHPHHDGAHAHDHEHEGGVKHSHPHGPAHHGEAEVHEHSHEHEGGVRHAHPHGAEHHGAEPEGGGGAPQSRPHGDGCACGGCQAPSKITTRWDGYLKVIGEIIENDPASAFIGRNDGFRIGNARLGLTAAYGEDLHGYLSLEASVARAEELNDANAELTVGPRDLYLSYELSRHVGITFGRFKAPYDLGELEPEGNRVFIDTPLESRGVQATQGFETTGLRQGRQIGVMLSKQRLGLSPDGFDVGYALALTNGRTDSLALNDNDRPAGFARFSIYYGDVITLNVGGFTDDRTVGDLPDLFDEEVLGVEGSLVLRFGDLRLEGQALYQRTSFPTTSAPDVASFGAHGQWSYRIYGFEAAYRFAFYDPNDLLDIDAVWEHTLGISYYPENYPLRFSLNATLAGEDEARPELENNRVALLGQYNF